MLLNKKSIYYLNLLSDLLLILSILYLIYFVRFNSLSILFEYYFIPLMFSFFWYSFSKSNNLYDEYRSRNFSFQLTALLKTFLYFAGGLLVFYFLFKGKIIDRKIILYFILGSLTVLSIKYYLVKKLFELFRKKGKNIRNVLLLGGGYVGEIFYNTIVSNPNFGYNLIGVLDDVNKTFLNGKYLGSTTELEPVLSNHNIDDVVIALPNYAYQKLNDIVRTSNKHGKRVRIIPDYFKFITSNCDISTFGNLPIVTLRKEPLEEANRRFIKRIFDVIFSLLVILFILSWITPIIFLINIFSSQGPTFFFQKRLGKKGKLFEAYKFRSMVVQDPIVENSYKAVCEEDNRITFIGKILRKFNVDELPQFVNVLRGEMSVVGPRPHAIAWHQKYSEYVEDIQLRHRVKPGITGWAQIHGYRGDVDDDEINKIRTQKRIELDLWYIENWSFMLDLQIIIMTIWKMLKGDPNAY